MHATQFENKLRRLNPRLYLGHIITDSYNKELLSTGIYFFDEKVNEKIDYSELDGQEFKSAEKLCKSPDKYITWCTYRWIPEGNWYSETGKVEAPGWRSILNQLIENKYISAEKARKEFSCPSLAISTYDSLSREEKFLKYA